jgi:LPXTG-motif cell wall-anchored protein
MKKKKRFKKVGGNKQKRQILVGVSIMAVVTSLVFSVYYIVTQSGLGSVDMKTETPDQMNVDLEGLKRASGIIDASFKEGATYLGSHCAGVCHMSPKHKDDILVKYNGDIIISGDTTSGGHHFTDHLDKSLKIPAGKYTVKLESFDSYTGRASADPAGQREEQYRIVFKDGGRTLARTGESKDLRDGVDEADEITVVNGPNNPIVLSKEADGITIQHAGTRSTGDAGALNGFEPVCMLLEKMEEPEEEPEKKPKKEKDDDCDASIGDYIWYDTNGNKKQDSIEEGISGVKVCAYKGNKKYCDTTDKHGKYKIKDLCDGSYKVVVKDVSGLKQTYDPDGHKDNQTKVKLDEGEKYKKADFGYQGIAPKTGLATNIILLIGVSTLITIGILFFMRKKGNI